MIWYAFNVNGHLKWNSHFSILVYSTENECIYTGGGCGQELAKWILQGKTDLDMYGYDIRY